MNDFENVTQVRPEIEGAEENMSAARQRLLSEIHGAPQSVKARAARRPWVIAGGLVGAAAAVAAGVLVVNAFAPPTGNVEAVPTAKPRPSVEPSRTPQPTAEPLTVASAFGAASTAAAGFTGLTVAPGQYLRIHTDSHYVAFYEQTYGWGDLTADRSNATGAWEMAGTFELYVPADPKGDWRYLGTSDATGEVYGPDGQTQMEQYLLQRSQAGVEAIGPASLPGGPLAPWPTSDGGTDLIDFLEGMPKDPAQLIAWIDEHQDTPPESQNAKVGWLLIELLAENVGSAEARSAMYTALSMLDGFSLTSVVGDVFTVALVTPITDLSGAPSTVRRTAAIDMSTGLVTETTVTSGSGSALVPDTLPDMRRTYTISVVDAAP